MGDDGCIEGFKFHKSHQNLKFHIIDSLDLMSMCVNFDDS